MSAAPSGTRSAVMETAWTHLTSAEIDARLAAKPAVILPIGSLEQHGPTGLCGTDTLCVESIAHEAARRTGVLVLPVLAFAPAQFNMAFAGTLGIRSQTLVALLGDIFGALAQQTVRIVFVLNGHGANRAAIDVAVHDLYATLGTAAPLVETLNWWELGEVPALRQRLFGDAEGLHATPSEISLTLASHRDPGRPCPAPRTGPLDHAEIARRGGDRHEPAALHRAAFPDGLVGSDPRLARAEYGHQLRDAAVAGLARHLSRAVPDGDDLRDDAATNPAPPDRPGGNSW